MAAPIGKKLREARLARGLTLEDVQHRTSISRPLLVAMENDDLGAFANQTYARKFFAAYARHLGVEVSDFLRHFRPSGLGGVVQYHPYLQPPTDRAGADRRATRTRHPNAPSRLLFIGLAALALAAGVAVWTGLRDRRASAPSGTLPVLPAPGHVPAVSQSPATASPPTPTPITPPDLPVRRAMPVDDDEVPKPAPGPDDSPLPLIESPRPAAAPTDRH